MWGVELAVMAAMIAVNSVFAAYEIALASVSLARLEFLAGERRTGADAAAYMKRHLEGSLAGVQLGITLVGAVAAATGGAGAEEQLAPAIRDAWGVPPAAAEAAAIAAVVLPLTVVTIIFGELVPKVFALRNKERVCLAVSPGMRLFVTAAWPAVWLLERAATGITSWGERRLRPAGAAAGRPEAGELQDLRATAALARTSRLIGPQEERIILAAAGLTARPVGEVMLPADAIRMLDADADLGDALAAARDDMHTRYPVTDRPGDPQWVVGYVNFKDIAADPPAGTTVGAIARPIPAFPASAPVSACLDQLIRGRAHIALVRDAAGAVAGMVTLEDIIEELVGDIEDEYDHLPAHVVAAGRGWAVGGGTAPEAIRAATGLDLPTAAGGAPVRHLSDWVARRCAGPLRGKEVIEDGPVRVVVRKVRRHHVLEALVERTDRGPA